MPAFLIFFLLIFGVGVGVSAGLHRLAKMTLPVLLPIIMSGSSLGALSLFVWVTGNYYSPFGEFGMQASTLLGCWFFLSALHLWFYRFFEVHFEFPAYPWAVLQALLLLVIQGSTILGVIIGLMFLEGRCYTQRQDVLVFTGHLKNLCVEQKGSGQCPTNEGALIAFDPPRYKNLQRCARTSYSYEPETERFEWVVKFSDLRMFADPENLPGVGNKAQD